MKEIQKIFEFWNKEKHIITIAFDDKDKACFIELERLIQMTGLSYELIPRLIGSSMRQIFYKPGDFVEHWGSICKKEDTVIKNIEFEYTDKVKVLQRELRLVPFKLGDFIVANGKNLELNPNREHDLSYYWNHYEEKGENTMQVIRFTVTDTLEFKLVCRSYRHIEERLGRFNWTWYDPEFFVSYQHCNRASEKQIDEFEDKGLNFYSDRELTEAARHERNQNKKDTFDGLTDGQYGDYDDFEGDIDMGSLKDDLGLD